MKVRITTCGMCVHYTKRLQLCYLSNQYTLLVSSFHKWTLIAP